MTSVGSEKKRNSRFIPAVRSFNKIMKVNMDKSQSATTLLVLNFEQNQSELSLTVIFGQFEEIGD